LFKILRNEKVMRFESGGIKMKKNEKKHVLHNSKKKRFFVFLMLFFGWSFDFAFAR